MAAGKKGSRMKGDLSFKHKPKPLVLGDFQAECFEYKGDQYILLNQDLAPTNPLKKSDTTIPCVNLRGPFVVALPELTQIVPIDLEIIIS